MNKQIMVALGTFAVMVALPAASLAANVDLNNGGFGQSAGNTSQFGVAACNQGTATVSQSVPIDVTVGGESASLSSAGSIAPGSCAYSYASYSALGMQAGQTYSVAVTIDPQKTVISNTDNTATYNITVPSDGAQAPATADTSAQSGNIFMAIINWFRGLFGMK